MRKHILAILFLSFGVVFVSCSTSGGSTETGSGGQTSLGGTSASGGSSGTGGQPGTGGASGTGGRIGSGGAPEAGGQPGSGGSGSGGAMASGGRAGQGGSGGTTGAGGGTTASGGTVASGGESGTGGRAGRDGGPDVGRGTGGTGTGGDTGTSSGGSSGGGGSTGTAGSTGATPSAGCGKTPTLKSGAQKIGSRNYMIRIPPNYDNNHPYPLVFAFHWNGGNMNDIDGGGSSGYTWSYYGLREQADNSTNQKMIFVAPDGNGGWPNSGGQDLKFVDDMVALIQGDLCVDTTRVFSMGFSYGGGMSYAIACARAKTFRAVAVYSGAQLSGCDGGKDPIAYIGIHGVSDGTCNISGGRGLRDKFVSNNGCTPQSPPEPSAGSGKHVCTSYAGCSSGHPVRWCAFDGGHTPGNVDGGGDDGAKTWTKGEVWTFFTQF
jgi:poly(3-hydroxybutyrate) depolymerase